MRGIHEGVSRDESVDKAWSPEGYESTERGWRCRTQSNKMFWKEVLLPRTPELQDEHDVAVWRKNWKTYFKTPELRDRLGNLLTDALGGMENANERPEEDAELWRWKRGGPGGGEVQGMFNFEPDMIKEMRSQTLCLDNIFIKPALCAHLCDMLGKDCESFGASDTSKEFSKCCFNSMKDSVGWDVNDWAQPITGAAKNWQCHRKKPTPPPIEGCPDPTTCVGQPVTCVWANGTTILASALPEECRAQGQRCLKWSDEADVDQTMYEGNCRSGRPDPEGGWEWMGLDVNGRLKAEESGMAAHWINRTLEEMVAEQFEDENGDVKEGLLYDLVRIPEVQGPWLEELAKSNRWTMEDLRSHRWTLEDLKTLPKDAKTKPGCVRNISYADCKAEVDRLFALGNAQNDGKPYVDSFDYLWGEHERTVWFDAYFNGPGGGTGKGYEEFIRTSETPIPENEEGLTYKAAFDQYTLDHAGDGEDKIKRNWNLQYPRFDGVSEIEYNEFFGIHTYSNHVDFPEDLKSACCMFKTPEGQTMRGAANTEAGKHLWKRKCTVCLE